MDRINVFLKFSDRTTKTIAIDLKFRKLENMYKMISVMLLVLIASIVHIVISAECIAEGDDVSYESLYFLLINKRC